MKRYDPEDCGYALHCITAKTLPIKVSEVGFLGIGLCTRGSARLTVNIKTYDMRPNDIAIIVPNSMVLINEASPDWEIKMICITRMELLREAAVQILPFVKDTDSMHEFLFQERENIVLSFHAAYNFLEMLLRDEQTVSKYEQGICVFRCLMLGIRDKSTRYLTKSEKAITSTTSLSSYKHFVLLLNEHCKTLHFVKDYADLLHITPQYLGRICRMHDGRGPKEIIDDMLIFQLKSAFKNTEKTMKEICYEYNFPNFSFMSSFFRRHTGFTPREFRNMYCEGTL